MSKPTPRILGLKLSARDAWKGKLRRQRDGAVWAWHFHHEGLAEAVFGDKMTTVRSVVLRRINTIAFDKPEEERVTRLKRFRPVRGEIPEDVLNAPGFITKDKMLEALHKKECKNCPYEDNSLFP